MSESEFSPTGMSDPHDEEVAQYHAVSGLAVAGLVFGVLAVTALIDPLACVLPLAGLLLSVLALRRIAHESPALIGRKAALAGLALSLLFGGTAVAERLTHRWLIRRQARQFAETWFDLLLKHQPEKAYQLTVHPNHRQPFDETLWDYYREGPNSREQLENYVADPGIRTLLALAGKARIRYWQTEMQIRDGERETLYLVYAVTYGKAAKRQTFFVRLQLQRLPLRRAGQNGWRVLDTEAAVRPASMGGEDSEQ